MQGNNFGCDGGGTGNRENYRQPTHNPWPSRIQMQRYQAYEHDHYPMRGSPHYFGECLTTGNPQGHQGINSRSACGGGTSNQGFRTGRAGTQSQVRPGHGHMFGAHTNTHLYRYEATYCRCRNPRVHGDAISWNWGDYRSRNETPISWENYIERALDITGTETIDQEQYLSLADHIADAECAQAIRRAAYVIDLGIAHGRTPRMRPNVAWLGEGSSRGGGRISKQGVNQPTIRGGPRGMGDGRNGPYREEDLGGHGNSRLSGIFRFGR